MALDKRKHQRFRANINAYAALKKGDFMAMGRVEDISRGGLALEFVDEGDPAPKDPIRMDLLVVGTKFHLIDGKCIAIHNALIKGPFQSLFFKPIVLTNRMGVCFEAFTEKQSNQLDHFLEHFTEGFAEE